jgi:DNA-binding transcriptional regulator YdaS (Cro superfamily)
MTILEEGIKVAGSQVKFAEAIGTSQQLVSYWVKVNKPLPIEFAYKAEAATGIPCQRWRPDFFQPSPDSPAA